ncbi:hypothetical protein AYO44_02665 [Planctomycetaceae bacterium SCGC AG-212-F19]|nr:hypothetical protein AYO44_02665 [Planctomycetaceae bacterium SCGC AG-212-F19]
MLSHGYRSAARRLTLGGWEGVDASALFVEAGTGPAGHSQHQLHQGFERSLRLSLAKMETAQA